jgi:hypothetical protein
VLPLTAAWEPGLLQLSAAVVGICMLAALPRVPGLALVGLAGLSFLLFGTHISHGLIDDSFITLRYARNFARGDGLVFNAGERVEGYTCFLWAWLLGSLLKLDARFDLVITAQVLGVLASLAALLATERCARTLAPRVGEARSILLLAGHFPLVFWGFSGMETGLCVALSTWGAFCMCRFLQRNLGALAWLCAASTLWVLAMLTRPELYLLYAAHLPFVAWRPPPSAAGSAALLRGSVRAGLPALVLLTLPVLRLSVAEHLLRQGRHSVLAAANSARFTCSRAWFRMRCFCRLPRVRSGGSTGRARPSPTSQCWRPYFARRS